MKKNQNYFLYSFLLLVMTFTLRCSEYYDPFTDPANANIIVTRKSFGEKDTLQVYCAETVSVITTVKELLDSFTIHIEKNRFWRDTCFSDTAIKKSHTFYFSLYDTGKQDIIITRYPIRINSEQIIHTYVKSPLKQDPVTGALSFPCSLKTTPVKDKDVFYNWDIGENSPLQNTEPAQTCTLTAQPVNATGFLWVTDGVHKHPSPKIAFLLTLKDTKPPIIKCLNKPRNDTVKTSDTTFLLRFQIYDQNSEAIVDSASINGDPFTNVNIADRVYTLKIADMVRFLRIPFAANVYAMDSKQFQNDTSHIFYVSYDINLTSDTRLTIYNTVQGQTIVFQDSLYPVRGYIENRSKQPLKIKAFVNASEDDSVITVTGDTLTFEWLLHLKPDTINTLIIRAQDTAENFKAAETLLVYHNQDFIDREKPVISEIRVDRQGACATDTFVTTMKLARIVVTAYDKNSSVSSVSIAGKNAYKIPGSLDWVLDSEIVAHDFSGNSISIKVEDKSKNFVSKTIRIFQNAIPVIRMQNPFPDTMYADSTYRAVYRATDDDNDPLQTTLVAPITSMTINTDSALLTWKPQKTDTGKKSVTLTSRDGYINGSVTKSWPYTIVAGPMPAVRFKTTSADLPDSLKAVTDTLKTVLHIKPGTGKAPFRFSVLNTATGKLLWNNSSDSSFIWKPGISDFGFTRLLFTVDDSRNTADTFTHALWITTVNHFPCTLYVYANNNLLNSRDTVKLTGATDTASLTCIIRDQDPLSLESFTITKSFALGNFSDTVTKTDTVFFIKIPPVIGGKTETLSITVTDIEGSTAWYTLYVRYPSSRTFLSKHAKGDNEKQALHD
jgi:hypothetical protein